MNKSLTPTPLSRVTLYRRPGAPWVPPAELDRYHGTITTRVTGRDVDIRVKLMRTGLALHYFIILVVVTTGFFVAHQIFEAFASGRIAEIFARISEATGR